MLIKDRNYILIAILTLLSTLVLWLPFIFKLPYINGLKVPTPNFQTVLKHWDGPLYVVSAKTLYDPQSPILKEKPLGLKPEYFAAHLPLYPLTMLPFTLFIDFPKAMLVSTLIASVLLYMFFYYFIKNLKITKDPLLLTIVFMFLTPRMLVIRSIGSPEPLFLLLVLCSIFFFIKNKYIWSGIFGALACATKVPGIALFLAYLIYIGYEYYKTKKINLNYWGVFLIPLGLVAVFLLYAYQYKDFFAFFHTGGVVPFKLLPFSVFNLDARWVGTGWLEEIVLLYFFYISATLQIYTYQWARPIFYFMIIFSFAIITVQHRDVSRYALPMLPFALMSFQQFLTSKKFIITLLLLLPAIYFYSWNFMIQNSAPISDWQPFL
ncbi:MAG TPA: hypothetical protein VK338_00675 [Candidatus Nitrosocosmicus sp.]|nr:hypothetical protein [Candidatus Nitrosocosmicus sp.]